MRSIGWIACLAAWLLTSQAHAATITGLFNTGVDGSGNALGNAQSDTHYVSASNNPEFTMTGTGGFPIGPWLGDDAVSTWISVSSDRNNAPGGATDNITSFSLPGAASTVTIIGQWAADDGGGAGDIKFDGVSTASGPAASFSAWTPFSITVNNVAAGTHALDFINDNSGGPGGVRVEISSATYTPVPEPTSCVLLVLGSIGVWATARRRRDA